MDNLDIGWIRNHNVFYSIFNIQLLVLWRYYENGILGLELDVDQNFWSKKAKTKIHTLTSLCIERVIDATR